MGKRRGFSLEDRVFSKPPLATQITAPETPLRGARRAPPVSRPIDKLNGDAGIINYLDVRHVGYWLLVPALVLLVVIALIYLFRRLFVRLENAELQINDLRDRLRVAEADLRQRPRPAPTLAPESAPEAPPATPSLRKVTPPPLPTFTMAPPPAVSPPRPNLARREAPPVPDSVVIPPLSQNSLPPPEMPGHVAKRDGPAVTVEAFMGVKLFAWLGGLALFLGVVFFVKYSFEHNLITPRMRVAIGALTGLGLVAGGLCTPRPRFAVTAQTLCATGIVSLYGITYAAFEFYHLLELTPAFIIMAAITFAAFLLAVRLNAPVVAVLGLLGGFLTPLLLATSRDNPAFLFAYLAVLDLGLVAIALRQRWNYLVTLAGVSTAVMQLGWLLIHFSSAKTGIAAAIFLGFEAFFLVPFWLRNREDSGEYWTFGASAVSSAAALTFAGSLLGQREIGPQPWICLSILLAADAAMLLWPLRRRAWQTAQLLGGGIAFLILNIWNVTYLTNELLPWALGYFLGFAALHTVAPIIWQRMRPTAASTPAWVQFVPALTLVLMLCPALHFGASVGLWLAILLVNLTAIVVAALTASLLGAVAALVLTLAAAALWLVGMPVGAQQPTGLLTVIAGFAALFCGAGLVLQKSLRPQSSGAASSSPENQALDHLPALSVIMPFALLIGTIAHLHPANPSAVFGVGLFLVAIILALSHWSGVTALPPTALFCASLLQFSWWAERQMPTHSALLLSWHLAFATVLFLFPFIAENRRAPRATVWITAALTPVLHFPLLAGAVRESWPAFWNSASGLVPAILAVPTLWGCLYIARAVPVENSTRIRVLAWFGGVALLFITLIFPLQFHHEWLTVSWALEGVALLWLFHRLPHRGLLQAGFVLLTVAFVRLALNPAVLAYHTRSGHTIWNWYLYTYGTGAACFFLAGWLTLPPRNRLASFSLPPFFCSFGTILLFLLLNIEIADYFSTAPTLTFEFEGNLARDMTYSIAWSLFGLALLLVGMGRQLAPVRYSGIGLLVATLAKLFLHDLARLDQLYRIGAFVAVAVVLIGASYLYQRFLSMDLRHNATPPHPPQ